MWQERESKNPTNRDIEEELRIINRNAIEYAERLAKGWAPGSWEEANLTHSRAQGKNGAFYPTKLQDGTYCKWTAKG